MKITAPEEFGFSPDRLKRIDAVMQRYVDQKTLAGIVTLVARRGGVVHFEKFGYQDVETSKPMELDTIFRIYSMTKPITSVALMMLFEHGLVRLTDPVTKFIPEFKKVKVFVNEGKLADLEREITIHDLLTHTAGLSYGDDEDSPVDGLYREADLFNGGITLEEMIRRIADLPLANQPGQVWRYSVATDVVGYLVEVISDMSLAEFFDEKIFRPLGMEDTAFSVPPDKIDRFATLYGKTEKSALDLIDMATGGDYFNVRLHSGGHGLVSTTADYLRFAQLVLNKGELDGVCLLGPKTVELMTTNHLPPALMPIAMGEEQMPGFGFGLGFSVMMDVAQSGMMGSVGLHGWGGWANTHFWVDPQEQLIGILMLQYVPSGTYPVTNDFRTLVYQALID
ncbi:MAG: beta-lactamase family protein [Anaerolineae bacterium]|nr:beta-lactamase family protein [Anaerolineae bacterium]